MNLCEFNFLIFVVLKTKMAEKHLKMQRGFTTSFLFVTQLLLGRQEAWKYIISGVWFISCFSKLPFADEYFISPETMKPHLWAVGNVTSLLQEFPISSLTTGHKITGHKRALVLLTSDAVHKWSKNTAFDSSGWISKVYLAWMAELACHLNSNWSGHNVWWRESSGN